MLAIILGYVVAVLAGVGVYFHERVLWKALVYVLVLFGIWTGGLLALSHWQARAVEVDVIQRPTQKMLLASDVEIERVAAKQRETELEAALVAARQEVEDVKAMPRELTMEEREAIGLAYMEEKAKIDAEIEELRLSAEEIVALEEVLDTAEKACGYHEFARAYALCEDLKATEGWPQNERLQLGVEKIEAIIQDYCARNQQLQAIAAWKADVAANRAVIAKQRAQDRAQSRTGSQSAIGSAIDRLWNSRSDKWQQEQRKKQSR